MKPDTTCTLAAIIGATTLETVALLTHTDGRFLGLALIIVAGLGGYSVGRLTRGQK